MNRSISYSFLIAIIALLLAGHSAQAITIDVQSNGDILFTDQSVLGEKNESESDVDTDESERERNQQKEKEMKAERIKAETIKLEAKKSTIKVKVESKDGTKKAEVKNTETKRLKTEFPAGASTEQKLELEARLRREAQVEKSEVNKTEESELEDETEFERKTEAERAERQTEKVEIRNRTTVDGQALEIRSRETGAELPGRPVYLNPETNELTIETDTGETRVLKTLPDQAVQRLRDQGALSNETEFDTNDLEVEITPDQRLRYTSKVTTEGRLFGLFPRKIEKKVSVDDETGEVSVESVPASNIFNRWLNQLTQ